MAFVAAGRDSLLIKLAPSNASGTFGLALEITGMFNDMRANAQSLFSCWKCGSHILLLFLAASQKNLENSLIRFSL